MRPSEINYRVLLKIEDGASWGGGLNLTTLCDVVGGKYPITVNFVNMEEIGKVNIIKHVIFCRLKCE